ncbi:MAG: hypothetical protein ACFCBU_01390 [Cyanophyceae cyanobacterium]
MDACSSIPPPWTEKAVHAIGFRCPTCQEAPAKAQQVWLNRRSPVFTDNYKRKWQEFYNCGCGCAWWGWSNERPPNEFADRDNLEELGGDRDLHDSNLPNNYRDPFS